MSREADRTRWLEVLLERLKALPAGKIYSLDPLERELLLEEISRLREIENDAHQQGIERNLST